MRILLRENGGRILQDGASRYILIEARRPFGKPLYEQRVRGADLAANMVAGGSNSAERTRGAEASAVVTSGASEGERTRGADTKPTTTEG